ncbi:MAG: hypothetical protein ACOX8Q_01910 [Christensenellales bacterium]|jgi:hypothetical protein
MEEKIIDRANPSLVFISVFVGMIIFAVTYILVFLLSSLIAYLVIQVGILRFLLSFITGGYVDYPICLISAILSYALIVFLLEKINNGDPRSEKMSLRILGIAIVLIHVVFLVLNIIYGNFIGSNIAQLIVGLVLIYKSTKL